MKIGIIGAGNIGVAIGKRPAANGHDVAVSFSRSAKRVSEAAAAIGSGAALIRNADVVVEYIRYRIPRTRAEAFLDAYRAAVVPLHASEYCLGYDLTQCAEEPESFTLRIRWTSMDDHLKGFRSSPQFREFLSLISPFVDQIEEMQHYAIALAS